MRREVGLLEGSLQGWAYWFTPLLEDETTRTHQWYEISFFGLTFSVGTTLLFDFGVYLTVLGTISAIFLNLVRR